MTTLLRILKTIHDVLQTGIHLLRNSILSPIVMWRSGNKFLAVVNGILDMGAVALAALLITAIVIGISRQIMWLIQRKHCHNCGRWTRRRSSGEYQACPADTPCCERCTLQHKADSEPRVFCNIDGSEMAKVFMNGLVLDVCGECGIMVLSPDEQEALGIQPSDGTEPDEDADSGLTGLGFGEAVAS